MAIDIRIRYSLESNITILLTEAPKTFLIPISLLLLFELYNTNPNKPKLDRKMAIEAKIQKLFQIEPQIYIGGKNFRLKTNN